MGLVKIVHAARFVKRGDLSIHGSLAGWVGKAREGDMWAVDVLAHCEVCGDFCCFCVGEIKGYFGSFFCVSTILRRVFAVGMWKTPPSPPTSRRGEICPFTDRWQGGEGEGGRDLGC